jgi:cytochrome c553
MTKTLRITILILVYCLSSTALAGDPAAGKAKAITCQACHGTEGISPNELWPNLAGQKEAYLIKQIKAFKDGVRTEPLMAPMVAPLSDQDVEDLAAFFSSLK